VYRLVYLPSEETVLAVSQRVLGRYLVPHHAFVLVVLLPVEVEHIGEALVRVTCDPRLRVHLIEVPVEAPRASDVVRNRVTVALAYLF